MLGIVVHHCSSRLDSLSCPDTILLLLFVVLFLQIHILPDMSVEMGTVIQIAQVGIGLLMLVLLQATFTEGVPFKHLGTSSFVFLSQYYHVVSDEQRI